MPHGGIAVNSHPQRHDMTVVAPTAPSTLSKLRAMGFWVTHPFKQAFKCPVCFYRGPFRDLHPSTGKRLHAQCPRCSALERHRLQYLVASKVLALLETGAMRMLHFAPEPFFRDLFSKLFHSYETADIDMPNVDHLVDLQALPFDSRAYDIVYASHVLEHVPDDRKAIAEIRRILAPGGLAILPVPIVNSVTVEYREPNPHESMHVRAPGPDYFDRFSPHFAKIDLYRSDAFPAQYQLFVYEDRTGYSAELSPGRVANDEFKHFDFVPVCYA
jgi:SAM-dependent methyltransferase